MNTVSKGHHPTFVDLGINHVGLLFEQETLEQMPPANVCVEYWSGVVLESV